MSTCEAFVDDPLLEVQVGSSACLVQVPDGYVVRGRDGMGVEVAVRQVLADELLDLEQEGVACGLAAQAVVVGDAGDECAGEGCGAQ